MRTLFLYSGAASAVLGHCDSAMLHSAKMTEQSVAHGAAVRADIEVNVVRRGPVNGGVRPTNKHQWQHLNQRR